MPRALNSANYTESFKGVHFSGVLPRVRLQDVCFANYVNFHIEKKLQ